MTDLTQTQKRVIAIMLVGGRLNQQEFNTLCNTDDIHKKARQRAVERIENDQELVEAIYPLE